MTTLIVSTFLLGLFLLVAIPMALVGVVVGFALWLLGQILVLPFRILGWGVGLGAGLIFVFAKVLFFLTVATFMLLAFVVGFLPLLPILLIAVGLWLLVRPSPRRIPRHHASA